MHKQTTQSHTPLLEDPFLRDGTLGYDPPSDVGCVVRCVSHGAPSPLIRWHYHEDYELHLVVETSGKFFVGDYIGDFAPGNLVLTGPRLPHNWITADLPPEGIPLRDRCIIFNRGPFDQCSDVMPELKEVIPLLDRAVRGVEFFGMSDVAEAYFDRIFATRSVARLAVFLDLLGTLNRCQDYRLLSYEFVQSEEDEKSMSKIDEIVNYIAGHYTQPLTAAEVSRRFHMSESNFSRTFRRGTGNTFIDFLIRIRISRACQLLRQSDEHIGTICYDVGFNNLANFNRRFLSLKGMTPSQFRHQSRNCSQFKAALEDR